MEHIRSRKDLDAVTVFQKHFACAGKNLSRGIRYNKGAVHLRNIRKNKASCFTGTGTADRQSVQVQFRFMGICRKEYAVAKTDILIRQDASFCVRGCKVLLKLPQVFSVHKGSSTAFSSRNILVVNFTV